MNCSSCEQRISDYLDGVLKTDERDAVELHLRSCRSCSDLLEGMRGVIDWGRSFPILQAPAWLASRIIANTPQITRETWIDTIAAGWKWISGPRVAMGLFTATLVLSWMGSMTGVSLDWAAVVRNPSVIYYEAQGAVGRAYNEAVRRYYQSPFLTEIKTRLDQIREISS